MKRVAVILVVALAASACTPAVAKNCAPDGLTSNGERLPDCTFATLAGPTLHIPQDIQGTPTVLNFWASWCVACIEEMPAFEDVAKRGGSKVRIIGMDAVGVSGETQAGGIEFARRLHITYPIAFDSGGGLYYHFQRRPTLPITVFVDTQGVVVNFHIGQLDEGEIRSGIASSLGVSL